MKQKKKIFSFYKTSLRKKVTLYFVIFGLIIFYITSVLYIVNATHNFVKVIEKFINQQLSAMGYHYQGDLIWHSVNHRLPELASLLNILKYIPSEFHSINDISFFCKQRNDLKWYAIIMDKESILRAASVEKDLIKKLESALKYPVVKSDAYLYGVDNTVSILMNISTSKDYNKYILKIDANVYGFISMINKMMIQFIIFSLIALILSHFIGFLFSRKIANPIRKLSEGASFIAKGNYKYRFEVVEDNEIGELTKSLNIMAENIEKHIQEILKHLQIQNTMNQIDKSVLSSKTRKELLDHVIEIVCSLLKYNYIGIAQRNEEKNGYDILSYYLADKNGIMPDTPFISDSELDFISNKNSHKIFQLTNDKGSMINIPLIAEGKYNGSFFISRTESIGFSDEEVRTIQMIGDQIGVALQKVQLTEEKEQLYIGILIALTNSIDAKSNWTKGHSERVANFASKIGLSIEFSQKEREDLFFSALLHDVGKLAIPENILDKPGKLTDDEFKKICDHPEKGIQIISGIPYFHDEIKYGILYHHERWDGTGYPAGLKKTEIPIFAQIIAIADVFDAITYDRPYRKGLSYEDADNFLKSKKEIHFSPYLVEIFSIIIQKEKKNNEV